jgi:hypothetical protein
MNNKEKTIPAMATARGVLMRLRIMSGSRFIEPAKIRSVSVGPSGMQQYAIHHQQIHS